MHLISCRDSEISFLQVYSNFEKEFSMQQEQTLYIFFILDGKLRIYTSSGIMDYVVGQYSISAIETPERGYVLAFSECQNFLLATVSFTANDVMNVTITLDDELTYAHNKIVLFSTIVIHGIMNSTFHLIYTQKKI